MVDVLPSSRLIDGLFRGSAHHLNAVWGASSIASSYVIILMAEEMAEEMAEVVVEEWLKPFGIGVYAPAPTIQLELSTPL